MSLRFLLPLLLLSGCKPDAALKKAEVIGDGTKPGGNVAPPTPPALTPQDNDPSAPTGSVMGTILFAGKAPAPIPIDVSMDPACTVGGAKVVTEQYAVQGGHLGNVFLYVKSGPPAALQAPVPQTPVVLNQSGCRYAPHVIGVAAGGYVTFTNGDPTMHNIHTMPAVVGNQTIDISQGPRGAAVSRQFNKPELMMPVRCNNHPWMNAFINVAPTPFFAVSDASGAYRITGLPPGNYVLGAVHEKMGEKTVAITIPPGGVAHADLSFGLGKP